MIIEAIKKTKNLHAMVEMFASQVPFVDIFEKGQQAIREISIISPIGAFLQTYITAIMSKVG